MEHGFLVCVVDDFCVSKHHHHHKGPGLTAMFPFTTDGGIVEIPVLDKIVKSPADRRSTGLGP
jgi:hypothetical protein